MKKLALFAVLAILLCTTCKKDIPEGKMAFIVGKWKWVYSKVLKDGYHNRPFFDYNHYPQNGEQYELEFRSDGKFLLTENGKTKKGRMDITDQTFGDTLGALIYGQGFSKLHVRFFVKHTNPDTLVTGDFPFDRWNIYSYQNYFAREH